MVLWSWLWLALGVSAGHPPEDAEQEQGYYLQQLFGLYGHNGTLAPEGLRRLLRSLGLGRVQVVQIDHEDLGHGHVAHLDALDLQDGRHVHARAHRHGHGHSHDYPGSQGPGNATTSGDIPPALPSSSPTPEAPLAMPTSLAEMQSPSPRGNPGPGKDPPGLSLLERVLALDHSIYNHLHEDCLNVSQLLVNFGLAGTAQITPEQFALLCPALLYQIDARVCLHHRPAPAPPVPQPALGPALGWAALAVTLLSLPSALALALVRVLGRALLHQVLAFLVALAAGTLCGDALLHLWPHAQGREPGTTGPDAAMLKGLALLGAIYALFLLENVLGLLRRARTPRRAAADAEDSGTGLSILGPAPGPPNEAQHLAAPEWGDGEDRAERRAGSLDSHTGHGHSHGTSVADMAWMVILGDGIHNLTDGLAIGAAFAEGPSGGLSTALAVFCHELPHELGDMALLLGAGLRPRAVLLANLLSALLAYVGMAIGVLASHTAWPLGPWIFAATAGVFLYVALVDMLPQMLLHSTGAGRWRADAGRCFVLQALGFLLGGGLMLTIALFEEQLSFPLES
ncbi:PREDICTED: zinc transporter ZIP5 isoform X1 [Crocodylus porosus]|uniref:zinc transporter ZIP5 isoform X1 n=1 Tax=Crocodylus porosus TaxID=8502 RepID=UPI000938B08C|nr:PREDICTED: zinc transporter ZIP5 isoform X1 [Crocodylus porosus]